MEDKDYYKILGIHKVATTKEIKSAYRRLAKKYHPDLNPIYKDDPEMFREITEAYDVLSDENKRRAYDRREETPRQYMEEREYRQERKESVKKKDFVTTLLDFFKYMVREKVFVGAIFLSLYIIISQKVGYSDVERIIKESLFLSTLFLYGLEKLYNKFETYLEGYIIKTDMVRIYLHLFFIFFAQIIIVSTIGLSKLSKGFKVINEMRKFNYTEGTEGPITYLFYFSVLLIMNLVSYIYFSQNIKSDKKILEFKNKFWKEKF